MAHPPETAVRATAIKEPLTDEERVRQAEACRHAWQARVARYLAWCVDGGLLAGSEGKGESGFTLTDVVSNLKGERLSQDSRAQLWEILAFLLHLRPRGFQKPFETKKAISSQLVSLNLLSPPNLEHNDSKGRDALEEEQELASVDSGVQCTFTDRVMQLLVESKLLNQMLKEEKSEEDTLDADYTNLLGNLLQSDYSSVNLKATICRQIISLKDVKQAMAMCPGLLHLLQKGGLFLATYACAALVSISQVNQGVKGLLLQMGIAQLSVEKLRLYDDELSTYVLMLLVQLTKLANNRERFKEGQAGLLPMLRSILAVTRDQHQIIQKRRLLTELCSVLGQMCNDDDSQKKLCEDSSCKDHLLNIFKRCSQPEHKEQKSSKLDEQNVKLASKALFALKQIATHSSRIMEEVGSVTIDPLLEQLKEKENLNGKSFHEDWANNAIMLLLVLSPASANRNKIREKWKGVELAILNSSLAKYEVMKDRLNTMSKLLQSDKP